MTRESHFPPGWDAERVRRVLEYYESQTEDEAVAEHEAAYENPAYTMMAIPGNWFLPSGRFSRNTAVHRQHQPRSDHATASSRRIKTQSVACVWGE